MVAESVKLEPAVLLFIVDLLTAARLTPAFNKRQVHFITKVENFSVMCQGFIQINPTLLLSYYIQE